MGKKHARRGTVSTKEVTTGTTALAQRRGLEGEGKKPKKVEGPERTWVPEMITAGRIIACPFQLLKDTDGLSKRSPRLVLSIILSSHYSLFFGFPFPAGCGSPCSLFPGSAALATFALFLEMSPIPVGLEKEIVQSLLVKMTGPSK